MTKSFTINLRPMSDIETRETLISVTVSGFGTLPPSDSYQVLCFITNLMSEIEGMVGGLDRRWKLLHRAQKTSSGWFARFKRLQMIEQ